MASLESVLEATGPIELTGARNPIIGALTMGYDPATGRRAFRLVLDPDADDCGSNIERIDDVEVNQVQVVGYPTDDCSGAHVCFSEMIEVSWPFGPVDGNPGETRECPPLVHDNGRITGLTLTCSCSTAGVRSLAIDVTVRVFDRKNPPLIDEWVRNTFRFCSPCHVRRS